MKCLVIKTKGKYCYGETGLLINVKENSAGNSIAKVLTGEGVKNWYLPKVEVVK